MGLGLNISGRWWAQVKRRARRRKIPWEVTREEVIQLFKEQKGKCALSGQKLTMKQKYSDKNCDASLDRINSQLGYISGNLQWTHVRVNVAKNNMTDKEFIDMCRKVVKYNS